MESYTIFWFQILLLILQLWLKPSITSSFWKPEVIMIFITITFIFLFLGLFRWCFFLLCLKCGFPKNTLWSSFIFFCTFLLSDCNSMNSIALGSTKLHKEHFIDSWVHSFFKSYKEFLCIYGRWCGSKDERDTILALY